MDLFRRWRGERHARRAAQLPQPRYWNHSLEFPDLPAVVPARVSQPVEDEVVSQSLFFQKLPGEIRNEIYKAAIGYKTIHLDLAHGKSKGTWKVETTLCRRKWLRVPHKHRDRTSRVAMQIPFGEDFCITEPSQFKTPIEPLAVMGLLLTCRQMYHESILFLFSENTFYIEWMSSPAILHNIEAVFPQSRLTMITSLELVCPFECFTAAEPRDDHRYCVNIRSRLVDNFPSLASLKLRFASPAFPEEVLSRALIDQRLAPVERIVTHYKTRRPFSCYVVLWCWDFPKIQNCLGNEAIYRYRIEPYYTACIIKYWRWISNTNPRVGYWLGANGTPILYCHMT